MQHEGTTDRHHLLRSVSVAVAGGMAGAGIADDFRTGFDRSRPRARIGRHCLLGGGVGVAGHLEIADRVHITGMSLVTQSMTQPGVYSSGLAVEPNRVWNKISARLRRLDELFRRLAALEKKIGRPGAA